MQLDSPPAQETSPHADLIFKTALSLLAILITWFELAQTTYDLSLNFTERILLALRAAMMAAVPSIAQIIFVPLLLLTIAKVERNPRNKPYHDQAIAKNIETIKQHFRQYLLLLINLFCLASFEL